MAGQNEDLDLLAALLDGPFRRLRDDNHIDPHRILVWDRDQQRLGNRACCCWSQTTESQ